MSPFARRALLVALGAGAGAWVAFWIVPSDALWRLAALDVLYGVVSAVAAFSAFAAARRGGRLRVSLLLLGVGALSWTAGEAAWTVYEIVLRTSPYPSLADVGYLGAIPFFAAAMLVWPRTRPVTRTDFSLALVAAGVIGLAAYQFVGHWLLHEASSGTVLDYVYPLAELPLLLLTGLGVVLGAWGERGRLTLVSAGLVALVAADASFLLGSSSLFDPLWVAAFAAFGLAALVPETVSARIPKLVLPDWSVGVALAGLLFAVFVDGLVGTADAPLHHLLPQTLVGVLAAALLLHFLILAQARRSESERLAQARAELERAYAYRHSALEASRTGVCLFGEDGSVRFCNSAFLRLLELEDEADVDWNGFVDRIDGRSEPGREIAVHRRGLDLAVRLSAVGVGEVLASVDDVTVRERERIVRDRFLAEVVEAQERSARQTAELLHEDAVQQLTALSLQLELASDLGGDGRLRELALAAGDVTRSIRRLVVDLHPAVLESQGVAAAVEASADSLRERGVEVVVLPFGDRMSHETELVAFRLVQEALANVLEHSGARNVAVELLLADGVLHCRVSDDGDGFDTDGIGAFGRERRLGLHLVRARLEIAGGRLGIESRPGVGTTLSFELPVIPAVAPVELALKEAG